MQDRTDAITQLDQVSEKIRMATQLQYNSAKLGVGKQKLIQKELGELGELQHREYFVSDGREGTLTQHLSGSDDFRSTYQELQNQVCCCCCGGNSYWDDIYII